MNRKAASDLLGDPDTSATVLHLILLREYGEELYGDEDTEPMDPVELWMRIKDDFHVIIPEENENKINALMLALSTDGFFEDPVVFVSVCTSLFTGDLGDLVDGSMDSFDITVPEILWGMFEVDLNRDDEPEFSKTIELLIDREIAQEAEDNPEMELGMVLPYFDDAVEKEKAQMLADLRLLEVPEEIIREAKLKPVVPEELLS